MVIKISLPIFITQTFTFLHNKILQMVYNFFSLLLLTFCSLFLKLSCPVIEVHNIFAEATNCNMKIVDW